MDVCDSHRMADPHYVPVAVGGRGHTPLGCTRGCPPCLSAPVCPTPGRGGRAQHAACAPVPAPLCPCPGAPLPLPFPCAHPQLPTLTARQCGTATRCVSTRVGSGDTRWVKVANSRAAACSPDTKWDPITKYRQPVEPADPGPIHAWLYSADPGPPIKGFLDRPTELARLRRWILGQHERHETALLEDDGFVRAACGSRVRVIYLHPFDTANVGVCPKCASMAVLWQTDPDEYDRQIKARNERWAELDEERYDEDDLQRQESYGTDPIDDDEQL